MTPFFFGKEGEQLFGIYYEPGGAARGEAALMCYPFGHEYMRSHMAFRQLASSLAAEGLHVLRFDYFGTGDSAGEGRDTDLARWRRDIALAAAELREISGAAKLTVIGLRLGALLAAASLADGLEADHLVLWDPVESGSSFLSEMEALLKEKVACPHFPRKSVPAVAHPEIYGTEVPQRLLDQLAALDLKSLKFSIEAASLISTLPDEQGEILSLLSARCERLETKTISDYGEWNSVARSGQALLAGPAIKDISAIVRGA